MNDLELIVNGRNYKLFEGKDFDASDTLSKVLREKFGLTGVRLSCDEGACGACTVLLDGKSVLSCMMLALDADGHEITTIEGLDKNDEVIEAFSEMSEPGYGTAMQCGFCTPGFVMEAHSLLNNNPNPSTDEIKEEMSGHICRCGCYPGIAKAVENASDKRKKHKCSCKEGKK
jgi:aerobic-type carbon monoxide dehydrogenase small subunit (CoxS/CutS family)